MARKPKDVFINGRWDLEQCKTCAHKWGNHGLHEPHKCCRMDCNCKEFVSTADEQSSVE